ncbi:MAG: excinuclease ABC subunit A [Bacteroidetes bacterium HGW-Bacteroidetes-21]|jgi:excinuclease ABC subunit A|nr:MAG: excinuclease ABC subunit A [Bacteroidetes bacterium HGW-Bacteroidetes-21]
MPQHKQIKIQGAREHNLKNINVVVQRDQFTVITGLSGSGKSTLAFDTLFAEGQRRYIESLSSYARQFLGKINKPEVDMIDGLPPAIAIEQRTVSRNPRSTVGTVTEIYEYLKLLYARIGKTYSPISGNIVKKHTIKNISDFIYSHPEGTKGIISFQIPNDYPYDDFFEQYYQKGFSRLDQEGSTVDFAEVTKEDFYKAGVIIDRFVVNSSEENMSRMNESIEKALNEGDGKCHVRIFEGKKSKIESFSTRYEADGILFEELHPHMFAYNSPAGACKKCEGYGQTIGIDPDLVIPNKSLSVYQDAVVCWKGEVMSEWKIDVIENAERTDFPIHTPYEDLTEEQKQVLWNGNGYFKGIHAFFKFVEENMYKIQYRIMLSRYRGKTLCPECHGTRIKKEASWVKINGKSVADLVSMPVKELYAFFSHIELDPIEKTISSRILTETESRLRYLNEVGLGYLTLNRGANTLSGGETQRIMLASQLGSGLVGSLYILDEPSIGLHPADTQKLIGVIKSLKEMGNTIVVVEHDEEIMLASDYIIDMGPLAGSQGGEVVYSGETMGLKDCKKSITAKYLFSENRFEIPTSHRKWSHRIVVEGAKQFNLKNIKVKFPLNSLVVVSGVSGSGKSTLVKGILYSALQRYFGQGNEKPGQFSAISGDVSRITAVDMIDQNPIGRSTRSNPVTYIKVYDEIRTLFSQQALAKQYGFKPSYFSFNVEGGRCEECQGDGQITIEMQFLADVNLVCDSCEGKRFKQEVLEVLYRGKSIFDILDMTIGDAITFFGEGKSMLEKKIVEKLSVLGQVGLDYLKMGQSSAHLSGGESQRLKLATYIAGEASSPMLFIFDEPTTGLHAHDVQKLLDSFNALLSRGHSIIVVEHNPDIIIKADWLIELGPEGGDQGGYLVFEGEPAEIIQVSASPTGKYLKSRLT